VDSILKAYGFGSRRILVGWGRLAQDSKAETQVNSRTGEIRIHLFPWWANKTVLAHETSHAILNMMGLDKENVHGPDFMRTFIDVLVNFGDYNKDELINSARDMGLEVDAELVPGLKYLGKA
jgi:hypothetical protein